MIDLLLRMVESAFDARSWHGANLMSAIRAVHAHGKI